MELYFGPLACSMATRIALYEAGASATFTYADTRTKRLADGTDFRTLNPLGQVPVLRTDAGDLLTENVAILQYVADQFPAANLAPAGGFERARLQQWLAFVATELHKGIFAPLFDPRATDGAKQFARDRIGVRFALLDRHLADREFLLDQFSVADAYLFTVLNWGIAVDIKLADWPAVHRYFRNLIKRPSIAKAYGEERDLYAEEQAKRTAA
jgi:glutathione S-transferase